MLISDLFTVDGSKSWEFYNLEIENMVYDMQFQSTKIWDAKIPLKNH